MDKDEYMRELNSRAEHQLRKRITDLNIKSYNKLMRELEQEIKLSKFKNGDRINIEINGYLFIFDADNVQKLVDIILYESYNAINSYIDYSE